MRTRLSIRRIDLWSLFKIAFFVYALIGLLVGLFYGFIVAVSTMLPGVLFEEDDLAGYGFVGGVLGLVLIPVITVLYGLFGSAFVTIGGAIYNLITRVTGGLCVETDVQMASEALDMTGAAPDEIPIRVPPVDDTQPVWIRPPGEPSTPDDGPTIRIRPPGEPQETDDAPPTIG